MCGIAFAINYGDKKIKPSLYTNLFKELSYRGEEASGYYFERKKINGIIEKKAFKGSYSSINLLRIATDKIKIKGKESLIIFHTRARTVGSEYDNNNNHPLFSDNFVLVHNGTIPFSAKMKDYNYRGKVDSERILAYLEKYGIRKGIKKMLDCISEVGSLTAIFKEFNDEWLYFVRETHPLSLIWDKELNLLIGISDTKFVEPYKDPLINIWDNNATIFPVPENVLFRVSVRKKTLEKVGDFNGR